MQFIVHFSFPAPFSSCRTWPSWSAAGKRPPIIQSLSAWIRSFCCSFWRWPTSVLHPRGIPRFPCRSRWSAWTRWFEGRSDWKFLCSSLGRRREASLLVRGRAGFPCGILDDGWLNVRLKKLVWGWELYLEALFWVILWSLWTSLTFLLEFRVILLQECFTMLVAVFLMIFSWLFSWEVLSKLFFVWEVREVLISYSQ